MGVPPIVTAGAPDTYRQVSCDGSQHEQLQARVLHEHRGGGADRESEPETGRS